jgi:hypothetical protein
VLGCALPFLGFDLGFRHGNDRQSEPVNVRLRTKDRPNRNVPLLTEIRTSQDPSCLGDVTRFER